MHIWIYLKWKLLVPFSLCLSLSIDPASYSTFLDKINRRKTLYIHSFWLQYTKRNTLFLCNHILFIKARTLKGFQNIIWRDPNLANFIYFAKMLLFFISFHHKKLEIKVSLHTRAFAFLDKPYVC